MSTLPVPSTSVHDAWVRDLSTDHAETQLRQETLGEYLASLGILSPATKTVQFIAGDVAVAVQRAALKIEGNSIKKKMFEAVLQGGMLPTMALSENAHGRRSLLDGLQRTHVEATSLHYTLLLEAGRSDEVPAYARTIMQGLGLHRLSADALLERPVSLQIWRGLTESEEVRMFMVLNLGQQRVTPRHLLEALSKPLARMFQEWGLDTSTEKAEIEEDKKQARWREGAIVLPPFRLEYLFPLMAALGKAREQDAAQQIEERKHAVVELVCAAEDGSDPLVLARPEGRCLASVLEGVRSNIGRTQRNIVYGAWRQYFRSGRATHGILIDWEEAAKLY